MAKSASCFFSCLIMKELYEGSCRQFNEYTVDEILVIAKFVDDLASEDLFVEGNHSGEVVSSEANVGKTG